jgi:hypothetical protein
MPYLCHQKHNPALETVLLKVKSIQWQKCPVHYCVSYVCERFALASPRWINETLRESKVAVDVLDVAVNQCLNRLKTDEESGGHHNSF